MIFLIGNGPSLNQTNLDLLVGQESWGMNRIHLIYAKTKWRPTRWWWCDHPQYKWHLQEIFWYINTFDHPCWIRNDVYEMLQGTYRPFGDDFAFGAPEHVVPWTRCKHCAAGVDDERLWTNEWHLGDGTLCKLGSGLHAMLQQAVLEGHKEIILIGCDLGFIPGHGGTHFAPNYYPPEQITKPEGADERNRTLLAMHRVIKAECDARGIEVVNATVGGNLEVYPRVKLEEIL